MVIWQTPSPSTVHMNDPEPQILLEVLRNPNISTIKELNSKVNFLYVINFPQSTSILISQINPIYAPFYKIYTFSWFLFLIYHRL